MSAADGRRVRLELAYDGSDYHGWQVQPDERSVQQVLGDALARVNGDRDSRLRGAGRTDAGVHARAQVADAWLTTSLEDAEVLHALRRMLPDDLSVRGLATVADGFDARRDALGKTYRYRIDRSAHGDPLAARYSWHLYGPLQRDRIAEAANILCGRHDWSGFTAAHCEIEDRVRTLDAIDLHTDGETWCWDFRGEGFLTFMVRNIVGTLVEVGRGRFEPSHCERILAVGDRGLAGPTAPARGLILWEVRYP